MGKTFKLLSLVGTSPDSYEDAIQNTIADAAATVRNLSWFEVEELRGRIENNRVAEYQVKLRVGFKIESA